MGDSCMKIKFNGMRTSSETGCRACGSRRKTKSTFSTYRSFILPSGKRQTFRAGTVEEVDPIDADFLLKYGKVDVGGEVKDVFEVVE